MRKPQYLSPTSLKCFEQGREEFYLRYLAENRPPKSGQTKPMSVGSAFDAEVKSYLFETLFGKTDPRFERDAIFEAQVEPHNRDWAGPAGKHVFSMYQRCGALSDLMLELNQAAAAPRFEFSIQDKIQTQAGGVPILGKPDIFFINSHGLKVIIDWKVNGYCSNSPVSPAVGYVKVRDCWLPSVRKSSKTNLMHHPHYPPMLFKGVKISKICMEEVDSEWADQLILYSWLLGEEPGSQDLVLGIDQICGQGQNAPPFLRVASHRCLSSANYQYALVGRLALAWQAIESGHIFSEVSREASDLKCQLLDEQAEMFKDPDSFEAFVANGARR